jgi:rhodanese-related sulfurtransferase
MLKRVDAPVASDTMDRASEGSVLIDIRELHELSAGHREGARCVPLGQLGQEIPHLSTAAEVIVICASGIRSRAGSRQLRNAGVPARNVKGSVGARAAAGGPVASGPR